MDEFEFDEAKSQANLDKHGIDFVAAQMLWKDPYRKPPPFEKLIGDLAGAYSRRINIQHRLVYQVLEDERVVKVLRLWSHYE